METKWTLTAAISAAALLFVPLLYSFVASLHSERRGPTETWDWIIYVRGISIVVALVVPALALLVVSQFQRLSGDPSPQQQFNLDFIAFLAGSALFLAPATISVIASIAGRRLLTFISFRYIPSWEFCCGHGTNAPYFVLILRVLAKTPDRRKGFRFCAPIPLSLFCWASLLLYFSLCKSLL